MSLSIVPYGPHLAEPAAELVCSAYRAARTREPLLPAKLEQADHITPLLLSLSARAPGVAAMESGRLIGFLVGIVAPEFKGARGIYIPEWAHGVGGGEGPEVSPAYRAMYAQMSRVWASEGCYTHAITIAAHQRCALDTFFWSEFGVLVVDAVRSTSTTTPATRPWPVSSPLTIRAAGMADVGLVGDLSMELQRELAAAPTFLPCSHGPNPERDRRWLAAAGKAWWLAYEGEEVLGYMRVEGANDDAAFTLRDEGTASITGALTREHARGRGVGARLLEQVVEWARESGYERVAVDFESANTEGSRFWLRHFRPVCYSLIRRADPRMGSAR